MLLRETRASRPRVVLGKNDAATVGNKRYLRSDPCEILRRQQVLLKISKDAWRQMNSCGPPAVFFAERFHRAAKPNPILIVSRELRYREFELPPENKIQDQKEQCEWQKAKQCLGPIQLRCDNCHITNQHKRWGCGSNENKMSDAHLERAWTEAKWF